MNNFLAFILSKKIFTSIIIIIVCVLICSLSKIVVAKVFKLKNKNVDIKKRHTIVNLINNLFRIFVITIGLILILQSFGVDTASFVASLGVFSLVVGLAIQDVLKDIIAGISMIFEGQYNIGDWVKIGDFKGEVLTSNFRTTKLKAYTGEIKIISNRNITEIINYSMSKTTAIIDVSVAYESDLAKVKKVLNEMCDDLISNKVVKEIECLGVQELEISGIVYRLIARDDYVTSIILSRLIKEKVIETFNMNNITIPYQQVVIHNE